MKTYCCPARPTITIAIILPKTQYKKIVGRELNYKKQIEVTMFISILK